MLPMLLLSAAARAQEEGGGSLYFYDNFLALSLAALAAVVAIAAVVALFRLLNVMVKVNQLRIYQEMGIEAYSEAVKEQKEPFWDRMYKKWTNVVPVEKEQDVLLDHNYDGIKELDNSLPPWWVAMFYLSIAFAVIYFSYYHFIGAGPSSSEEYKIEMERAEKAVAVYLSTQANLVDETNVAVLHDEQSLAAGKTIYDANCLACHGALGEGGVGPNFTDKYWIHGGDIKDLFKVIKYGVPEKGMIAWKSQLSAADMSRVASYILTLQGTDPPNAKEPEGELYEPQAGEEPSGEEGDEIPDQLGMSQ